MSRCLHKVVLQIFFSCFMTVPGAFALPDSSALPASLQQQLAAYRQQDDLESWIYARIAFAEKDPAGRIGFLMRTREEMWRPVQFYEDRLAWFDLLTLQGYYQLQTGNILASISAYEAALEYYESYPLPDADILEPVLKPLGNNYTRLADYTTALFIHQKTLTLALANKDRQAVASVYSNMAICARWQGDLASATVYCRTGLRYANPQQALFGLLLSTWADILAEQNKFDTAAIVCGNALRHLQAFKQPASSPGWYAGALQIASAIAWKRRQFDTAIRYAEQALRLLINHFPLSKQREKAKVYVLLGDICYSNENPLQSMSYYQQALSLLIPSWKSHDITSLPAEELLYSENTLADALSGKAAAFEALHRPQEALQHYLAAFMAERKLRKEFFYAESKLKELQVTRSRVEAAMKLAYGLYRNFNKTTYADQLLLIAEVSRAQVLMDERRARVQTPGIVNASDSLLRKSRQLQNAIVYYQHELLNTANKKTIGNLLQATEYELSLLQKKIKQQALYGEQDSRMLTVPQLRKMISRLPARVSVLEFFAGNDSSFIIEYDRSGIVAVHCIPQCRFLHRRIQQFMQQWFANGPSAMIDAPKSFYEATHALYRSIFTNYGWKKDRHYLLMPDGMFNYLPFDALLTSPAYHNNYRDWPYLCKQVSLSQAYSLQTWHEQQTANYPPAPFTAFFVSKGKQTQQALLSIDGEYQALQQQIRGRYYINESATRQSFGKATDSAGILHISTHAISSAMDPFPYLQLFDAPYYLFDLRYKHFSPALVVLGACKTADGVLLEGEGVNSLSRGFTAAGAGGVVSGLWNVHDQAAIALLQDFYLQLQQQNNPATALHRAKQQWLQTDHVNGFMHLPYYWAGFVYSGHLQPVQVAPVTSYTKYYWLTALLMGLPLLYIACTRKRKRLS